MSPENEKGRPRTRTGPTPAWRQKLNNASIPPVADTSQTARHDNHTMNLWRAGYVSGWKAGYDAARAEHSTTDRHAPAEGERR